MNAGAIVVYFSSDRPAQERQVRLVREDQRHRIVVGWAAAGLARLLAQAAHHEIGADRNARSRARADGSGTCRVIGVARIARPGAALIAEHRGEYLGRKMHAARIART